MNKAKESLESQSPRVETRDLAIDRLRGALVILMVIGDYLSGIRWVPDFLKHASDVGFTIADAVAPFFVFVIGLNFGSSFNRRMQAGAAPAYRHFVTRYLSLIGIGAVISAGGAVVGEPTGWGVLQALGVAGLIALVFIRIPTWARFLVGSLILGGYQYLLDIALAESVVASSHGGFFGAISWGALLILSTAVADIWRKGNLPYLVCVGALSVAAIFAGLIVPISKHRVSLSFVLITLALSAATFLVVELVSRKVRERPGLMSWWGQNALALYLIHLLVLAAFVTPGIDWWYSNVPLWLAAIELIGILGFMSAIAYLIQRRKLS